jgi:flagella basal body P-ring formation protein FlgA
MFKMFKLNHYTVFINKLLTYSAYVIILVFHSNLQAAIASLDMQNPALIQSKVEDFLQMQTLGAPGRVEVSVGAIDPQIKLAKCVALEASLPVGSRAWGKTTIAVTCTTPSRWTIYVQANVSVFASYIIAATPLAQGRVVALKDITFINGNLASLPAGIYTEASQVIGLIVGTSLTAGSVLRQELLRNPLAVKQGQSVRIISSGSGFVVGAAGYSLSDASVGQLVQVRAANGNVVSGVAKSNGEIEVNF